MPQDYIRPQVEDFIDEHSIELCANDYNADPSRGPVQTNAVHDLFQQRFQKPVFLVINAVSNSPSQAFGALLVNQGGGVANWTNTLNQWQAIIDKVEAPPPRLTQVRLADGTFQFTFPGQRGRTNQIEWTTDFVNWTALTNVVGTNAPVTIRETNALFQSQRFYRGRRL